MNKSENRNLEKTENNFYSIVINCSYTKTMFTSALIYYHTMIYW